MMYISRTCSVRLFWRSFCSGSIPSSSRIHNFQSERGQLLEYVTSNNPIYINKLEQNLMRLRPNEYLDQRRKRINRIIFTLDKEQWRLIPIGSCVSGLAHTSSDIDFVMLPSDPSKLGAFKKKFLDSSSYRNAIVSYIRSRLKKAKLCKNLQFIPARVPIVRFGSGDFEVDIQFGNIGPIYSTNYIRSCVEQDERVFPIIQWVQNMSNRIGVQGSDRGLLSRYHFNMLTLFFLQQTFAGGLPILPPMYNNSPQLAANRSWVKVAADSNDRLKTRLLCLSSFDTCFDHPANVIIRLVDYFSTLDMEMYGIDIERNSLIRNDDCHHGKLILKDPYFPEVKTTCRITNATSHLTGFFGILRHEMESGFGEKSVSKI